jgi:poly(U)-specific endoribonuclease
MSSWAAAVASVESKLVSFVKFAIAKLDAATEELTDEDPEDNYQELCTFAYGMSRNLKATGAGASAPLKAAVRAGLLEAWDIGAEKPGVSLRETGVPGLRAALEGLLKAGGALGETAAKHEEAEAAHMAAAEENASQDTKPSNIKDMSMQEAFTHLWDVLDKGNRLEWGDEGFTLHLQSKGRYNSIQDRCSDPLFSYVTKSHPVGSSKVTTAFINLRDNYERATGQTESFSNTEKREMSVFMDAFCATDIARFVFNYLKIHGKDRRTKRMRSMNDFKNIIYDIWFAPYRRFRRNDSSGFEHVFVGEEKKGQIIGLHNWLQFYLEEKKGNVNYLGWAGKQDRDYSDDCNIVSVKFTWDDDDEAVETKPISTMLCGSTVEFEIAILTLTFLGGDQNGDTPCILGSERCKITCHPQRAMGGPKIGTAYIEIA